MSDELTPCGSCPWRRGASSDRIPGFSAEMATCDLRNTVGRGDEVRPMMACHLSEEGADRICIGYLASDDSYHNIAARIYVMTHEIDWSGLVESRPSMDLYDTFDEMIAALVPESAS